MPYNLVKKPSKKVTFHAHTDLKFGKLCKNAMSQICKNEGYEKFDHRGTLKLDICLKLTNKIT